MAGYVGLSHSPFLFQPSLFAMSGSPNSACRFRRVFSPFSKRCFWHNAGYRSSRHRLLFTPPVVSLVDLAYDGATLQKVPPLQAKAR
jgi:hypothetical protein